MKTISTLLLFVIFSFSVQGQSSIIEAPKGYTNDIGNMISMLDNLKQRVERIVAGLSQEQTDFLLDEDANRIGAIIYHLAATEAYYQVFTFEKRGFNNEENEKWMVALNLGEQGRKELKDKPISYYLEIYDDVRNKTKELLKTKDDKWFSRKVRGMSNHWAWFHVMEHQANHMGQLALISKRLPK